MKKQSGFTLIELVIVVVILGFLAVTAIPKFIDLTDQAKQANIEGMAGGFATAVSLVRAQWEAEGRPKDTNGKNAVDYDGTTLFLTKESNTTTLKIRPGYITGIADNGDSLAGLTATDCIDIWQSILQQPPRLTNVISTLNSNAYMDYFVAKSGSNANTLCHFYLKETLNKDNNNNFTDPGVLTTVGNSFTYQPANSSVVVYINNQ
ncbi:type II secretion system protein [Cognaticolwellia mytili]|uniref:type II secretion system protein n=1 Tax=Cognaticolwellia mytili TaxID=1888913 RepID=UPI000A16FA51|nr:type II secretion system protein [Cognaticolwellia mytili]